MNAEKEFKFFHVEVVSSGKIVFIECGKMDVRKEYKNCFSADVNWTNFFIFRRKIERRCPKMYTFLSRSRITTKNSNLEFKSNQSINGK